MSISHAHKFSKLGSSPSPLSELLTDLKRKSKRELAGPCWRCGGEDRLIVFEDSGRGWCRQCGWKGDSIQLLRDRDGLSFRDACERLCLTVYSEPIRKKAKVHSLALARTKRIYKAWHRRRLGELADQFQLLLAEKDVAEIAYRAIHRCSALYTQEEQKFWTLTLASLYDRLAPLEYDLDLLTYSEHEAERFQWWQEEVCHG